MRRLKRLGRRLLVVLLGVATVWLILVLFFDVADRRLPLVLALAATYGLAAYVILPRAIRLGVRMTDEQRQRLHDNMQEMIEDILTDHGMRPVIKISGTPLLVVAANADAGATGPARSGRLARAGA